MLALIIGHLLFASNTATALTLGSEACEDVGHHVYVLDLRSAERMDGGLHRVRVIETLKGSPRAYWDLHVRGLIRWQVRPTVSDEEWLAPLGRAYVIVGEDSRILNSPKCRPTIEQAGEGGDWFEEVLLAAKTYMRLRENPHLSDVLSALQSPRDGERRGAVELMGYVYPESVPGSAWDVIGMAVVEELERSPLNEMTAPHHYTILSQAAQRARHWHVSQGLPPPSWLRRAGRVVYKRMEAGKDVGRFCRIFGALLGEMDCTANGSFRSPEARLELKKKVESLPAPRED